MEGGDVRVSPSVALAAAATAGAPRSTATAHAQGTSTANRVLKGHRGPKSKSGCTSCKARRIKCDETHPECQNCSTKALKCIYLPPKVPASRSAGRPTTSTRSKQESAPVSSVSETESPPEVRLSNGSHERTKSSQIMMPHKSSMSASGFEQPPPTAENHWRRPSLHIDSLDGGSGIARHHSATHVPSPVSASVWAATGQIDPAGEQDEESFLTRVFFQTSTHLFSIYTGPCNPFMRLKQYLPESKALRLAVQAMAALTISDYQSADQVYHMDRGLELQRLAYRELSFVLTDPAVSLSDATFAAVVHIGMTEPWHSLRSDQSGAMHLRTSKVLICQRHQARVPLPPKYLCNLLLYWDLLVSLHSDSSHDGYSSDMLLHGKHSEDEPIDYIDPTLGVGVHLTQIIIDMENFLRFYRLQDKSIDDPHHVEVALALERRLKAWQPDLDSTKLLGCIGVFETSSLQDILLTSEAYRQTALLLLYRSVPKLLLFHNTLVLDSYQSFLQQLASTIVSTLAAIAQTSPVCTTHEWILFVAAPDVSTQFDRQFIRERMSGLLEKIGISGIKEVMNYIEEVWEMIDSGCGESHLWMENMHRRQWYPLLG